MKIISTPETNAIDLIVRGGKPLVEASRAVETDHYRFLFETANGLALTNLRC